MQCIPNLFLLLGRDARRCPKVSGSAEWMVTFPEPPVDAYVPPRGFRETDQAEEWSMKGNIGTNRALGNIKIARTWFTILRATTS